MIVDQFKLQENKLVYSKQEISHPEQAHFVLLFTSRANLENARWMEIIQERYSDVPIISCSSSGEIYLAELLDNSVSAVAVQLEKTSAVFASTNVKEHANSYDAGRALGKKLAKNGLTHAFIASDGWIVTGSQMIDGLYEEIGKEVSISGGMAGDGANFSKTLVGLNDNIDAGNIVAIGFYGEHLQIGHGSHGGWNEYGDAMKVTKCDGRNVFEINDEPALELYKKHLGKDADGLPGTALLYPVSISVHGQDSVRTVHSIDNQSNSIVLGEPIEQDTNIRFMKAKFDNPLQGVEQAALDARAGLTKPAELSIVVSCIGRKLLFDQAIQKEIEITQNLIGPQSAAIGFYSYGEICTREQQFAQVHHQMMTVTSFVED